MNQRPTLLALACLVLLAVATLLLRRQTEPQLPEPADQRPPAPAAASAEASAADRPAEEPAKTRTPARAELPAGAALDFEADAIYGTVRRQAGPPLQGATVTLLESGPTADNEGRAALATLTTDERGGFRFSGCQPFARHELRVAATGFTTGRFHAEAGRHLDLELAPGGVLHGRVLEGDDRRPVPGAWLAIETGNPPVRLEAETDAAGCYRFTGVPGRTHLSLAVQRPYAVLERFPLLSEAEETCFDVVLGAPREVAGIVLDADTGATVAGATLWVEPQRGLTRSDQAGRFTLRTSRNGYTTFWAQALGYASTYCEMALPDEDPPPLVQVGLRRGAVLEGVVRDGRGAPLAGATVTVFCSELPYRGGPRPPDLDRFPPRQPPPVQVMQAGSSVRWQGEATATTMADGSFRIDELGTGWGTFYAHATASLAGHGEVAAAPVELTLPKGHGSVDFVLEPAASSSGTVSHEGQPVAARVDLTLGRRTWHAQSNDRGAYRFAGLPPGKGQLVATRDGAGFLRAEAEVVLAAGRNTTKDLALAGRLGRIQGHVQDDRGAPIAGLRVFALPEGRSRHGNSGAPATDAAGAFVVLVPGETGLRYTLHLPSQPEPLVVKGIAPDGPPLRLTLPSHGVVRLELTLPPGGEPLGSDCQVVWRRSGDAQWRPCVATFSPSGAELRLPAGPLELRLDPSRHGYQLVVVPSVVVPANGVVPLLLTLRALPALIVQVIEGRELLADHQLTLRRIDRATDLDRLVQPDLDIEHRAVELDAAGRARLTAVKPGRYEILCDADDVEIAPAQVTVTGEAEQEARFRVRRQGGGR